MYAFISICMSLCACTYLCGYQCLQLRRKDELSATGVNERVMQQFQRYHLPSLSILKDITELSDCIRGADQELQNLCLLIILMKRMSAYLISVCLSVRMSFCLVACTFPSPSQCPMCSLI